MPGFWERKTSLLGTASPFAVEGRVREMSGLVIKASAMPIPVGSVCRIRRASGGGEMEAEVVGFRGDETLLMTYGDPRGIARGDRVKFHLSSSTVAVGDGLLGRVMGGLGQPIDGKGDLPGVERRPLYAGAPDPVFRRRIHEPMGTGVKAIDSMLTFGRGQRVGIFAGSGVGKSVLLGMIARHTDADVSVVALVGERGREVREFLERDLGESGLRRSVVVVATSDEPALVRVRAALVATAIAEYFRDAGKNVVLLMDSLTRIAIALREIGLSAGEPPATRGYPPSMFAFMPRLLERTGTSRTGSITGIYAVLVEADDMTEPVADTARSILDGHVWLDRGLFIKGQFPAVDPLASISRVMRDVVTKEHFDAAARLRRILAAYRGAEDLIQVGAYVKGANSDVDAAIPLMPGVRAFLSQGMDDYLTFDETVKELKALVAEKAGTVPAAPPAPRRKANAAVQV
ncbi:MAG: FliI/YscN family ATPase [Planctomycetota bacterium]